MNSPQEDFLIPGGGTSITVLPKVSLHDHLDGGLRAQTIIELADGIDLTLPTTDAAELAEWFSEPRGFRLAGGVPQDLRRHHRGHADP